MKEKKQEMWRKVTAKNCQSSDAENQQWMENHHCHHLLFVFEVISLSLSAKSRQVQQGQQKQLKKWEQKKKNESKHLKTVQSYLKTIAKTEATTINCDQQVRAGRQRLCIQRQSEDASTREKDIKNGGLLDEENVEDKVEEEDRQHEESGSGGTGGTASDAMDELDMEDDAEGEATTEEQRAFELEKQTEALQGC